MRGSTCRYLSLRRPDRAFKLDWPPYCNGGWIERRHCQRMDRLGQCRGYCDRNTTATRYKTSTRQRSHVHTFTDCYREFGLIPFTYALSTWPYFPFIFKSFGGFVHQQYSSCPCSKTLFPSGPSKFLTFVPQVLVAVALDRNLAPCHVIFVTLWLTRVSHWLSFVSPMGSLSRARLPPVPSSDYSYHH